MHLQPLGKPRTPFWYFIKSPSRLFHIYIYIVFPRVDTARAAYIAVANSILMAVLGYYVWEMSQMMDDRQVLLLSYFHFPPSFQYVTSFHLR